MADIVMDIQPVETAEQMKLAPPEMPPIYELTRALSVTDIQDNVKAVKEVMGAVMVPKMHYGVIPGTDKPSLYKPGAEILCLLFNLGVRYPEERLKVEVYEDYHRSYLVVAELYNRATGTVVGQGIGEATTLESKHRFVTDTSAGEDLEFAPPKEYWDAKNDGNRAKMRELLRGPNRFVKKTNGYWSVWERAGNTKVERPNVPDVWNTVLKMAKKRAYVDAVISATGCSDLFTQDLEDIEANRRAYQGQLEEEPLQQPAPAVETQADIAPAQVSRAPNPATKPAQPSANEWLTDFAVMAEKVCAASGITKRDVMVAVESRLGGRLASINSARGAEEAVEALVFLYGNVIFAKEEAEGVLF